MYKCLNRRVERDMNFIRQQEELDYNTRTKLNFRHPSVKRNRLEQTRDCILCPQGF